MSNSVISKFKVEQARNRIVALGYEIQKQSPGFPRAAHMLAQHYGPIGESVTATVARFLSGEVAAYLPANPAIDDKQLNLHLQADVDAGLAVLPVQNQ